MVVSKNTVRRTLKEAGLNPFHRSRQQKLTDEQKRNRVVFAKNFKDHDWETTLMTDETEFEVLSRGNTKNDVVWARDPETGKATTYADVRHADEVQFSVYNFELADTEKTWDHLHLYEKECQALLDRKSVV